MNKEVENTGLLINPKNYIEPLPEDLVYITENIEQNIICSECKKQGLKSKVYPKLGTTTLLYYEPFYDEEGKYHHHDSNINIKNYECSKGHKWSEKSSNSCWYERKGIKEEINVETHKNE